MIRNTEEHVVGNHLTNLSELEPPDRNEHLTCNRCGETATVVQITESHYYGGFIPGSTERRLFCHKCFRKEIQTNARVSMSLALVILAGLFYAMSSGAINGQAWYSAVAVSVLLVTVLYSLYVVLYPESQISKKA